MSATLTHLSRPRTTLGLLAFAQLIIALDYNIVFVALPDIAENLPFSESGLQWVVSAYAVVFGGFLMLGGRLADLFGRRRLFIAGLGLYAAASLLGGFAADPWMLVTARGLQGLGGALLAPATLSLVTTLFAEGSLRNRALGVWAAAGSTGMIIGSLLGGVLAGSWGWESVFFVNVPLALGGLLAATVLIPSATRHGNQAASGQLDMPGALTSTLGVLAVVYGFVQAPEVGWLTQNTLLPLLVGLVLLVVFLALEQKVRNPLVPLQLFGNRALRVGTATAFMFMASFGAIPYFVTIYLQQVQGVSPFATGLIFMLPSACVLVGTMIGGRAANVWSSRSVLVVAWLVGITGTVALAFMMARQASLVLSAVPFVALSLAQGVVFTLMFSVSTSKVPAADQGVASGIATSGQQIGGAVGLAVLVVAATGIAGSRIMAADFDLTAAGMGCIALLLVLGLLIGLTAPGDRPESGTHADEGRSLKQHQMPAPKNG